jgi:serine phosphatase RsbU (regulator of sigma subunit)
MRLKICIVLILCLLTGGFSAVAQKAADKKRISDLEKELNTVKEVKQISILCNISMLYAPYNASKAGKYLDKAAKIVKKNGEKKIPMEDFYALGSAYKKIRQPKKAALNYEACLKKAKQKRDSEMIQKTGYELYEIYNAEKDYKALEYYKLYVNSQKDKELKIKNAQIGQMDSALIEMSSSKDSLAKITEEKAQKIELLNQENDSLSRQNEVQDEDLKLRQAEIDVSRVTIDKQRNLIWTFIIIGVVFLILLAVVFTMFRKIKKINNRLENQRDEIEVQKNLIQVKNEQITDSINYARKIQDSILVPEQKIKRWLPQMFIYYKPKDIVSGDFYWFSKYESKYVITAIDCTGHGVPGAFLSMIGNTLLHEIVNIKHVFKPDQILSMLHDGITLALNQEEDSSSEDGMDMSLCTVDTKLNRFQFAGAKNNLYVVQGDKLKILKANYYSIGGKPLRPDMKVEFTCYDFMYDDNTSIYMFSDGYLDQYGGENNEKFNTARFREMILANRELPMEEQKEILSKTMDEWKGDRQQIDDFLVMGVKLSELGAQD